MAQKHFVFFIVIISLFNKRAAFQTSNSTQISKTDLIQSMDYEKEDDLNNDIFPLSPFEVLGLFLIVTVSGLANSGGIGGGTLLTSIIIIFFYYTENQALGIVYCLVFGGSLGNFLNIVRRRDPHTGKPLINFDLALLCMPLMIMGTTLGVILGRMVAPLIIIFGIIIVTFYSTIKVYRKAKKQYREETTKKRQSLLVPENNDLSPRKLNISEIYYDESNETNNLIQKEKIKNNYKLFPKRKYSLLFGLLLTVMLFSVLRGTEKFPSIVGLLYCGVGYWISFVLTFIFCFMMYFVSQKLVKRNIQVIESYHTKISKSDFKLNHKTTQKLAFLSTLAGVLAGLLGIGGGMIMNPTLLDIGVSAPEVAATSGFFVVQTSFISLFQSLLYQDVPLLEEGFFFLISLLGSFIVSFLLSFLIKRTNRPSIILFSLIIVLVLSIIITPVFEIWQNLSNLKKLVEFGHVC